MTDSVDFIESLDVKESTKRTYRRALEEYLRFESRENCTPSDGTLVRFKWELLNNGKSENTVNSYLNVANAYYKWLAKTGKIQSYIAPVKGVRTPNRHHEALTTSQVLGILSTNADVGKIGGISAKLRNEAIVMTAIYTGMRVQSIASLRFGDLRNVEGSTVLHYYSKGHYSNDSLVVVVPELAKKIYDYLETRETLKDSDFLFISTSNNSKGKGMSVQSIANVIRDYYKMNGINNPRITPHSTRATAGTFAYLGGASVKECANMLGHQSEITFEKHYLAPRTRMKGIGENAIADYIKKESGDVQTVGGNQNLTLDGGTRALVPMEATQ